MNATLQALALLAVPGVPIILGLLLIARNTRAVGLTLAPWAALPGLLVALAGWPAQPVEFAWLLVGTTLDVGPVRRLFLLFTSILWLAAGVYAASYHRQDALRARMFGFFLFTLTGNLGLIIAADAVTFYLGFLTMSLAAYGLIVHAGDEHANRAGRIYLILVVASETLILPGLWIGASQASSLGLDDMSQAILHAGDVPFWLLAAGLGVKAAIVPLHVWLPLAHPVAPTPASAVLSGAMVKAGLLGWLVILPAGEVSRPDLAGAFVLLGLVGALGGAVAGVMQDRPKSVLAYSSVSQMGLIIIAFGMALGAVQTSAAALTAVSAYALHHALAKGALFLGVGCVDSATSVRTRRLALILLLIPALSLAGLPFTSGMVAKTALKQAVYGVAQPWHSVLEFALPLAAVGTTLLMARFLWLMLHAQTHAGKPGLLLPWCLLLVSVCVISFFPFAVSPDLVSESLAWSGLWSGVWPIVLGVALAAAMVKRPWQGFRIPEGDVLWPIVAAGRALWRAAPAGRGEVLERFRLRAARRMIGMTVVASRQVDKADARFAAWPVAALLFLVALLGSFALLSAP